MTATYKKLGVEFLYPENWTLSEDDSGWPQTISLESPHGSLWTLYLYPESQSPAEAAEEMLTALRSEYEGLEAEPIEVELSGYPASGHDIAFYYLDLLIEAKTRSFAWGGQTALLVYQGESRDLDRDGPVFEAITHSLLSYKAK